MEQATIDRLLPTAPDHLKVTATKVTYRLEDAKHRDTLVEIDGVDDKGLVQYLVLVITDKSDDSTRYGIDAFQS